MPEPNRWRLFVAADLPDTLAETLEAPLRALDGLDRLVRRSPPSGIHLTLAFLGSVETSRLADITARLQAATSGVGRFAVDIGGAGVFPSASRPQVVWIDIADPGRSQLVELAARVAAQLRHAGFELEERRFRPHLTLGRIRTRPREGDAAPLRKWLAEWRDRSLGRLEISSVSLIRSQLSKGPPVYTRLQTFGLQ